MIRRLEIEPLGAEATRMRQALFVWMVGSERLQGFDAATGPIDGLESSSNSYREELMLQFLFGGAGWVVRSAPDSSDLAAQQEAGIRSMLAAYKNMAQVDANLADPFLDKLDEIRRMGELRDYILRKNRAE
jgi:hypothetical protein